MRPCTSLRWTLALWPCALVVFSRGAFTSWKVPVSLARSSSVSVQSCSQRQRRWKLSVDCCKGMSTLRRRERELLRALFEHGVIKFPKKASHYCGFFAVWKQHGDQRIIIDARIPDTPSWSERSGRARRTHLCRSSLVVSTYRWRSTPQDSPSPFKICSPLVLMGWNQALNVCQWVHERISERVSGISAENWFTLSPLVHTEYVDNFMGLSQQESVACDAAERVSDALAGLLVHPIR